MFIFFLLINQSILSRELDADEKSVLTHKSFKSENMDGLFLKEKFLHLLNFFIYRYWIFQYSSITKSIKNI
jgi:hypothetical protein